MKRFFITILVLGLLAVVVWFVVLSPGGLRVRSGGENEAAKEEAGPKTDGKMTNAPAVGGTVVLDLPPVAEGESRSLVDGDGMFELNAEGDLVRTYTGSPATGVVSVKVQTTKGADETSKVYTIGVKAAEWTLEAFPEMVIQALTQEGVTQPGPVAEVRFDGVMALAGKDPVAKAPAGFEPVKLEGNRGIEFAADKGQRFTFAKNGEAQLQYRWAVVIFRVEANSGTGKGATLVVVNDGPLQNGRSGNWIPRLEYNKADESVTVSYRGWDRHDVKSPAKSVKTDGSWNVALTYRRAGQIYLRVNGQESGEGKPETTFNAAVPEDMIESQIGNTKADNTGWALDGQWLGQSELSEKVVEKMEAWALTRAAGLPGGAAAKAAFQPVVDAEDFPHRYSFNAERWKAWRAAQTKERRREFQGQPVEKVQPDRSKWVRVFLEDFRKPAVVGAGAVNGTSIGDSTFDKDAGKQIWFAPGTNTAVGGKAYSKDGNDRPWKEAYVLDPVEQTLTMRLYCFSPGKDGKPGKWASSQFTSVTATGLGYSWAGPKGFRVRVKQNGNLAPGLFPAPLWFYGIDHLYWRTGERIEFDIIELDDNWDNYGGTHVHNGTYKGLFGHSAIDTMNKKATPEELRSLKLEAGEKVAGINGWDGNWHTWEVWIEEKTTYINCDGIEIARADTTPEYLERLYMFVDTCLKDEKLPDGTMGILGMDETKSYDMIVDTIEGFAPPEVVNATPGAPFTGRPTLVGTGAAGSEVTCTANVEGVKDVLYYWHSGGYPRGFGRSNTYTVLPEDKGAEIRCMVKAVGAKDQPESWTEPLVAN